GIEQVQVEADREQLSRALINLIKNAMQSIPTKKEGIIRISLSQHDESVCVIIADNGTGIPEEIRPMLFQPNFTTKSSGMGLGLAIVKKIVENFGGRIWYDSVVGEGTSFFVELPVYPREA
ncbi:MAG: PAS domain-containing sensor histidine kinase, partial [Mangrovibacterium sp.]